MSGSRFGSWRPGPSDELRPIGPTPYGPDVQVSSYPDARVRLEYGCLIIAGQVLGGRFEMRRRLGSGGMGEVFEAFDRDRAEVVAVKTLTRADADTFARFKREFRALQSTVHPNLVSIGELICADDIWFFTMELVDGTTFGEHVRGDHGALRAVLRQLVVGL